MKQIEQNENEFPKQAHEKSQNIIRNIISNADYERGLTHEQAKAFTSLCERAGAAFLSNQPRALSLLARAYKQLGNLQGSLSHIRAALVHYQYDDPLRHKREKLFELELLMVLMRFEEAEQLCEALRRETSYKDVQNLGDELKHRDLEFLFEFALLKAELKYMQGNITLALEELYDARSYCSSEQELIRLDMLEAHYESDIGKKSSRLSHYYRMLMYSKPQDLTLSPKTKNALTSARLELAQILISSAKHGRAEEIIGTTLSEHSESSKGKYLSALFALGSHDYEEAIDLVKSAQNSESDSLKPSERYQLYWLEALALFAQGEFVKAASLLSTLNEAQAKNPHSARNLLLEAHIRLQLNDGETARSCAVKAARFEDYPSAVAQSFTFLFWQEFKYSSSKGSKEEKGERVQTPENLQSDEALGDTSSLESLSSESYASLALLIAGKPELLAHLKTSDFFDTIEAEFFAALDSRLILASFSKISSRLKGSQAEEVMVRLAGSSSKKSDAHTGKKDKFSIQLLGSMKLMLNGHEIDIRNWRKSKSRELFLAILINAGKDISRDLLIEQIWPDLPAKKAMNDYYVTWSSLRKLLSGGDAAMRELLPIKNSGSRFYVDVENCYLDIHEFERLFHEVNTAQRDAKALLALKKCREARSLYQGDLLPGDLYYDWLEPKRAYYRELYLSLCEQASKLAAKLEFYEEALSFAKEALKIHPGKESLVAESMRLYLSLGKREEAIKLFHTCKKYLSTELGLDPSARLSRLYIEAIREFDEVSA